MPRRILVLPESDETIKIGIKSEGEGRNHRMKLLYAEDERSMSEAIVDILTYHKYMV